MPVECKLLWSTQAQKFSYLPARKTTGVESKRGDDAGRSEAHFRLAGGKLDTTWELIHGSSKTKSISSSGFDQRSLDNHSHSTLASE